MSVYMNLQPVRTERKHAVLKSKCEEAGTSTSLRYAQPDRFAKEG